MVAVMQCWMRSRCVHSLVLRLDACRITFPDCVGVFDQLESVSSSDVCMTRGRTPSIGLDFLKRCPLLGFRIRITTVPRSGTGVFD